MKKSAISYTWINMKTFGMMIYIIDLSIRLDASDLSESEIRGR